MLFKKFIHHSHVCHIFWQDIFEGRYKSSYDYVLKFGNTWKVHFDNDKYINGEIIYEEFESIDDFTLHILFGAFYYDYFINEEEIYDGKEEKLFLTNQRMKIFQKLWVHSKMKILWFKIFFASS